MTNCFASDACADTSDTWKNPGPGTGIAVSPDNILDWDVPSPQKANDGTYNGTYGYNEPLAYFPAMFRHRYAWAAKAGNGSLKVTVVDENGAPVPNARIYANSVFVGKTGSADPLNGIVQVSELPTGNYAVEAQYSACEGDTQAPPPPTPTPISELTTCPTDGTTPPSKGCTVQVPTNCPGGFTTGNYQLQQEGVQVCACYKPPRLLNGCGGGDDEANARQWKVMLTPAADENPNSPLVCNGASSVVTNSGTCDPFDPWVCFDDRIVLGVHYGCKDSCEHNNANLTEGIIYQNIP